MHRKRQSLNEIAQCGDVCLSNLWCSFARALDGLGDNLDEGHARTVAVDQGGGGTVDTAAFTAEVRQLARVLLHVGALNLHAPLSAVF